MSSRSLPTLFFLALAAGGFYSILVASSANGLFPIVNAYAAQKSPTLPGTSVPFKQHYTGIGPLDAHLVTLMAFFWPSVSGDMPDLALFTVYMAGQLVCMHVIVLLEGLRAGNSWRVVSFSTVWGLLYQNIPWGFIMPVYHAVYSWTSPIAASTSTPRKTLAAKISAPPDQILTLPAAMTLGLIIPTILPALPSPRFTSYETRQNMLTFWQGFPLWVGLCQFVLSRILPSGQGYSTLKALRVTYTFALSLTTLIHTASILFLYAPHLFTALIPSASTLSFRAADVFLPTSPFSTAHVPSLSAGCLNLLQYDMYFSCGATLVWAVWMYRDVCLDQGLTGLAAKLGFWLAVAGPGGAALVFVWGRDERILKEGTVEEEKRQ